MARTMTIDTGDELRSFVESLVDSGDYKTNSEVIRAGLRLLQEQTASSKLYKLRTLIREGEESGDSIEWSVDNFLDKVNSKPSNA
jgi:antitoxin ParD1/3/4